ncbi:MAG TPA: CHRD domain-containing protein [Gaiellales bacterium]|jgi:Cu/Zn superoxide dismutase|nr:CHRD domain-containing protein [Gaiellales bacterium]
MRNSRFVVALAAVACAAALPAAAAAHTSHPAHHGHPGKGTSGNTTVVRLAPAAGQKAKGFAELTQRTGALSVAVRVSGLTPGAFYATHLHSGSCLVQGASVVTFPDLYADEHGVAKLVTTVPTDAAANFVANGFYVDVHAGPSASTTPVISCGDLSVKPPKADKSAAFTWLKGSSGAHGRAELFQKGSDVSVWISLSGLKPGAHAVHLHAGTCAAPGSVAVSLGDVTAGPDGKASMKIASTSTITVVTKGFSLDVHAAPSATATPADVVACGDLYGFKKHGHFKK